MRGAGLRLELLAQRAARLQLGSLLAGVKLGCFRYRIPQITAPAATHSSSRSSPMNERNVTSTGLVNVLLRLSFVEDSSLGVFARMPDPLPDSSLFPGIETEFKLNFENWPREVQ